MLAVTLAQEFGLFALLTAELDRDPEGKVQHLVAVGSVCTVSFVTVDGPFHQAS